MVNPDDGGPGSAPPPTPNFIITSMLPVLCTVHLCPITLSLHVSAYPTNTSETSLSLYNGCPKSEILWYDLLYISKILFCPIFWEMSYFILFFGQFAFNFGILYSLSPLFHSRTFPKIFQPHFTWHQNTPCPYHALIHLLPFSLLDAPVKHINVGENNFFS